MKIWTINTASENAYADIAVVANDEQERDRLTSEWEAETAEEEEGMGDVDPASCEYHHSSNSVEEIADEDLDDGCGLSTQDGPITWRDLIAEGAGITLLDSGRNG